MADQIAVMNLGVLQQYGSPAEIYNSPTNRFVAGFVGSTQMNFLPASDTDPAAHEGPRRVSVGIRPGKSLARRRRLSGGDAPGQGEPRRAARGEGRRPPLARRPRRAGDRHARTAAPDRRQGRDRRRPTDSTSSTTRPARQSGDGFPPPRRRDEAVRPSDRAQRRLARDRGRRVLLRCSARPGPARRRCCGRSSASRGRRRATSTPTGSGSPTSIPATVTSRSCSRTSRSTRQDRLRQPGLSAPAAKAAEGRDQRARPETAEILHIEHLLERKPAKLSGGERQRVALGRALVRDPRRTCSTSRSPPSTRSSASRCARS